VTVLAAIGNVCWALIDAGSLGDQYPLLARMIDRQTTGDLLGAPAELEMSFYVLLDGRIAYPWAGALNLRRPMDRVFAQNA